VQPGITDQPLRQKALKKRLRKREYSKGEILYAVDELADDPELDDKLRYGGDLSAADFRRIIEPIRETRARLLDGQFLSEKEVYDATDAVPGLTTDDFGRARSEDSERPYILKNKARERLSDDA